jgi:hypothetical protein
LPQRGAFAPLEKALTIRPKQSPVKLEVRLRFALRSCYSAFSESHRERGRAETKAKVASRVAAKITDPSRKNLSLSSVCITVGHVARIFFLAFAHMWAKGIDAVFKMEFGYGVLPWRTLPTMRMSRGCV